MMDWDHAYGKEHCLHCNRRGYRQGFYDAASIGLVIVCLVIIGMAAALR